MLLFSKMDPEVSALTASFKPDTVLQSLVDLTSGATLLKAGRSVSVVCVSARTVRYCVIIIAGSTSFQAVQADL